MDTSDNDQQTTAHGKRKNTGIIIGAVVVLTLIAVWLVPGDKPEHADIPLPAAKPALTQMPAQPVPTTADTQPSSRVLEGDAAREFIAMAKQTGASVDTLFNQAEEMRQSGKLADAHLLYFEAARQGHAGAAMALAKQADPAFYSADSSVLDKPYIIQARKWYLAAAKGGDQTATELLENLHQHVQAQAAAGNPDATRLMLQWK